MNIIEYTKKYEEVVKDLLVELQEYIAEIDDWHLNIMTPEYRETYFKKNIKPYLSKENKIFLAVDDGAVLGMIFGKIMEYDEEDKCCYACPKAAEIKELIVSKSARGKGVGKKLLEAMEEYFKGIGCEYCHIDVFEPNVGGLRFYEREGYITRMRTVSKKL